MYSYTKYSLDPYHTTLHNTSPINSSLDLASPHCSIYTMPHYTTLYLTTLPLRSLDSQSLPELFHLMRRQFTSVEWEYIKYPQEEFEQLSRFYRLWVSQCRHACTAFSTSCLLIWYCVLPCVTLTHHRTVI